MKFNEFKKNCIFALMGYLLAAAFINNCVAASKGIPIQDVDKKYSGKTDTVQTGFFIGMPAALYTTIPAWGIQIGYQFKKIHLHIGFDVNNYKTGHDENERYVVNGFPTIGIGCSKIGKGPIVFYGGFNIGLEQPIKHSFDKPVGFLNAATGIEFYALKKSSFFLEIAGAGFSFPYVEGAYQGGTLIKAGSRYYF